MKVNLPKMILLYERLLTFLTPIKMFSLIIILLGLIDHISEPLELVSTGTIGLLYEFFLRATFIFCGMFGLLGNGKTRQIRATVAGVPFLYLAIIYLQSFLISGLHTLLLPMVITSGVGMWTIFVGAKYEQRNHSVDSSSTYRDNTKRNT